MTLTVPLSPISKHCCILILCNVSYLNSFQQEFQTPRSKVFFFTKLDVVETQGMIHLEPNSFRM